MFLIISPQQGAQFIVVTMHKSRFIALRCRQLHYRERTRCTILAPESCALKSPRVLGGLDESLRKMCLVEKKQGVTSEQPCMNGLHDVRDAVAAKKHARADLIN